MAGRARPPHRRPGPHRRARPAPPWARCSPARPRRPRSPPSSPPCGSRARRSTRCRAWCGPCSTTPSRCRCRASRRTGRHVRHRRRPQPVHQRLDHRRLRGGRRRGPGCASTAAGPPPRRRVRPMSSKRSGWSSTSAPRVWPAASTRPAWGSASRRAFIRPCASPSRAPRARRAHRLQLPGPAGQPGPGPPPGGGGERPRHGRDHARRPGRERVPSGHGRARGRRPRRAVDHGTHHRPRGRCRG